MAIESLQANQGIYKALSKLTGKDYYKTKTGVLIKTDKGKGSVTYNKDTGEITCEGLENALITGSVKADKINIVDCKNIKATGGLGNDEFTVKYSDTVQINGGLGKDQVTLYDNPKNIKLKSIENEIPVTTPPAPEPTIPEPEPTDPPREFDGNGEIGSFKPGTIDDGHFLSTLIAMCQTEAGAQIIKDSITWDDENRQVIVHCKGLGADVTVSYDELKEAREYGNKYFALQDNEGHSYSEGDDDAFLLEYVMTKLAYLNDNELIFFTFSSSSPKAYDFLAGVKSQDLSVDDEDKKKEILDKLEADNHKNLFANASTFPNLEHDATIIDANGKTVTLIKGTPPEYLNCEYAIKEVKDGLVTIVNPLDPSDDSEYTATLTYEDFCKYFRIDSYIDLSETANPVPVAYIEGDTKFSDYGITITTAKVERSNRNGEIEWSMQGGIGDCWCLSQINAMSYTEAGRKIIKESIVWDDENRQAIVHCKGLGIDMVISYDELKEAEEKGNQYYVLGEYAESHYSFGDDDMFLLEYVMTKLFYLEDNKLIDFQSVGSHTSLYTFLAGTEDQISITNNEEEIKEFLDKLEADGGKNLVATVSTSEKISEDAWPLVEDANGKTSTLMSPHAYAIKEVKNGLVTVVNPWNSSDVGPYTQTFTYDEFCKYFTIHQAADLSKTTDETSRIASKEGVNLSDYGIIPMPGTVININRMLASFDERVINELTPYKEAELVCGVLCIDTTTDGVQSYNEIKINDNDQILNIIKEDLNSQDKIKAFKLIGNDGKPHLFINDNGNIRHYICYNYNAINDNNFYEEIKMTDDEFKNYLYSILDSQEYITKYSIYADYETPEPTIPNEPERDGIIEGAKQGDIGDSKFFAQLIAMSQTEAGAKIIKDSIVWDDENRQATVHCKGLGVDITISYDRLEYAKENGIYGCELNLDTNEYQQYTEWYSSGDDDVFLLEYVMRIIHSNKDDCNFQFKCVDNRGVFNPYTFLAGVKYDTNYLTDEVQIKEALSDLEADKGQKLIANANIKSDTELEVTDVNGKVSVLDPNQTYAIAEVKNGLVTIVNPKDSTNDSEYTQTFTYAEFSKYFNITNPADITKTSDIVPEIYVLEDDFDYVTYLSWSDITITTAKITNLTERNGIIEVSRQGDIGDCGWLSTINAMSYTEEGRRIIKESIVWDDENQQAIVHCKGLGIDMVVTYDELKYAEEHGTQEWSFFGEGRNYSSGDDDVLLLEYIWDKLLKIRDEGLIQFDCADSSNPQGIVTFMAGTKDEDITYIEENDIKEVLKRLEENNNKDLFALTSLKSTTGFTITDANGNEVFLKPYHAYAIKEVKNGFVTVVNPWNSSDGSPLTATLTYDDFCKYFDVGSLTDLSKQSDKTPVIIIENGVNLADYGITVTTGILRNNETEPALGSNDGAISESESRETANTISDPEDEPISEPIEVTITNLIPDSNPAPPPEPEVIFIPEPEPEPTEAEHTILDAGLDMKKSERKGTLTFEQQTPEPEPAEAPQKTTFKTISGSFLKTTGKISKK